MAAKKPAAPVEKVKKQKPQVHVKIPKYITSSTDKVWRKLMIKAIQEQAQRARYGNKDIAKLAAKDAAETE